MAWPSGHGLTYNRDGLKVRPVRLWWHVSNVPFCRLFWDLARFRRADLRHVENQQFPGGVILLSL